LEDIFDTLKKIENIGSSITYKHSDRKSGSMSLLDLAHEHTKSIAVLMEKELYGSAYALLRSCIEGYFRGRWLLHCATDDQVTKFTTRDAQWPKLTQQIIEVAEHQGLPNSYDRYIGKNMGLLDALTHGLSTQIKWRCNDRHIGFTNMTEENISELHREVVFISFMSTLGMVEIAQDTDALLKLESITSEVTSYS